MSVTPAERDFNHMFYAL